MPKIKYKTTRFRAEALETIKKANIVIEEYAKMGYTLTLRQLYYQFVSRDWLANSQTNYKKLAEVVSNGRLAGLIDWEAIEDRTRGVETIGSWESPDQIVEAVAQQYKIDLWKDQLYRPEVWIEKEALAGVFERICKELRLPYLSCRGYTSQSEMWRAGMRLRRIMDDEQIPVILHFGDHDPSGIDMSRDIVDRLKMFTNSDDILFERMALNMDQVRKYKPPPNPAKMEDTRAGGYINLFGRSSWELDALDPATLADLVRGAVAEYLDKKKWNQSLAEENEQKAQLQKVSDEWQFVIEQLENV